MSFKNDVSDDDDDDIDESNIKEEDIDRDDLLKRATSLKYEEETRNKEYRSAPSYLPYIYISFLYILKYDS